MSKWRTAGLMLSAGIFGSTVSTGAIFLYWKMEAPLPLRPVAPPMTLHSLAGKPHVVDIPTKQYAYLGSFAFNTETVNSEGDTVWETQWVHYDPDVKYKFVAPIGLRPGEFSVLLNIDYKLNPLTRTEESVKFLELTIDEEKNESNIGAN